MVSFEEQQNLKILGLIVLVVQELDGLLMFQIFPCTDDYQCYVLPDSETCQASTFVQGPCSTFALYLGNLRKQKQNKKTHKT